MPLMIMHLRDIRCVRGEANAYARHVRYAEAALSALLERFCAFDIDDWRDYSRRTGAAEAPVRLR